MFEYMIEIEKVKKKNSLYKPFDFGTLFQFEEVIYSSQHSRFLMSN